MTSGGAARPATAVFRDARTVVIAVHGVGDHTSVDILKAAVKGPALTWGETAHSTELEVSGIPMPRDVDPAAFGKSGAEALEIRVGSEKHIVLPVAWSGVRPRAGRWAAKAEGPMAMWVALPVMLTTCFYLFRCVRYAHGMWKLGVASLAALIAAGVGGLGVGVFYLSVQLPRWVGTPFDMRWYSPILAVGSFALLAFLIVKLAAVLDFVGDVAWYVSHKDHRKQNITKLGELIQFVAESAPDARIIVAGHSLGTVLTSQSLSRLPATYAGAQRTLFLTMGSPLLLMSRVFPGEIESPTDLHRIYLASGAVRKWVNLWRTRDVIGQGLHVAHSNTFIEMSLGMGGHSNYWGDERVWATVSRLLLDPSLGDSVQLGQTWHGLPLTATEIEEMAGLRRMVRALTTSNWIVLFWALGFQIVCIAPWERQFTAVGHILILLIWNVGLIPLLLVPMLVSHYLSRHESPRDLLHKQRFFFKRGIAATILSIVLLTIVSSHCVSGSQPLRP